MTGDGYDVDTVRVGQLADTVAGVGSTVHGDADSVRVTPDAGRSSDEVASAFNDLAAVVAGLAAQVGGLADSAEVAAGRYATADEAAQDRFAQQQAQQSPGPGAPR